MQRFLKHIAIIQLILFISLQFNMFSYASTNWSQLEDAPKLDIATPCAILIDSKTGNILYEKNSDNKMYPASITKIMTAILAIEKLKLDDKISYSRNAVMSIEPGSSNAGFMEGEELTTEQSLYSLLLWSANESANAIAEKVSGSVDDFAKLMTKRAKELGAKNTNFVNANGLQDPNHYTSAYDMAMITKYAMTLPEFRKIVSTVDYTIPPTNKWPQPKEIHNKNQLILPTAKYYYPNAIGIKTGYTTIAGSTLVAAAKKDDTELIAVVLNSPIVGNDAYCFIDTIKMFDYGFENFKTSNLIKKNEIIDNINIAKSFKKISAIVQDNFNLLIPKFLKKDDIIISNHIKSLSVPVKKGDSIGYISVKYGKEELGRVNLLANDTIAHNSLSLAIISISKALLKFLLLILKWILIIFTGIFLLFLILTIIHNKMRKNKRRRRRKLR